MKIRAILYVTVFSVSLVACNPTEKPKTEQQDNTTTEVAKTKPMRVSVAAFKKQMEAAGSQLIDVRTDQEVAEGMLPNAIQINVLDMPDFTAQVANLDPTKPVLVYCKSGGRSAKAADYLSENGFTQIYELEGGYTNWVSENGEIVKP